VLLLFFVATAAVVVAAVSYAARCVAFVLECSRVDRLPTHSGSLASVIEAVRFGSIGSFRDASAGHSNAAALSESRRWLASLLEFTSAKDFRTRYEPSQAGAHSRRTIPFSPRHLSARFVIVTKPSKVKRDRDREVVTAIWSRQSSQALAANESYGMFYVSLKLKA
jgi:hypothetical protein